MRLSQHSVMTIAVCVTAYAMAVNTTATLRNPFEAEVELGRLWLMMLIPVYESSSLQWQQHVQRRQLHVLRDAESNYLCAMRLVVEGRCRGEIASGRCFTRLSRPVLVDAQPKRANVEHQTHKQRTYSNRGIFVYVQSICTPCTYAHTRF